jgi:hypothetical protein
MQLLKTSVQYSLRDKAKVKEIFIPLSAILYVTRLKEGSFKVIVKPAWSKKVLDSLGTEDYELEMYTDIDLMNNTNIKFLQ